MNLEQLEGKWEQVKGQIQEKWQKLTDTDLTIIRGKKAKLVGKLRERYGFEKDEAERQLESFSKDCDCDNRPKTEKGTGKPKTEKSDPKKKYNGVIGRD